MARNRKNEVTALRPGAAFKAGLICLVIVTSCVGYVWQKQQINVLAEQIGKRESRLAELREQNIKLGKQVADLYSPAQLDKRVRELKLGLVPAQPTQIWYRPEPASGPAAPKTGQRFANGLARTDADP